VPLSPRDQSAPPLCWLHGFTQTGRSAHQFRSILAASRDVISPDLARHGANADVGGSLDEIADAVMGAMPDGGIDLGGYSFGARVALHAAIRHPERVRRLVLLGATRGIRDDLARVARRERDARLAERAEELGAETFIAEWLAQPMFASLQIDECEAASRRDQRGDALASSLREAGTGTQRWLGEEVTELDMPVLAMAGALDVRFAEEARAIARSSHGQFAVVPGAGHAAHIQQPVWSSRLVLRFLSDSVDAPRTNDEDHA
jgi:2-succinyl-6-hydroxy-2,4-cyclohexadiene-1-carboxylate synthase